MDQMESSYKLGQYIGISLLMAAIFALSLQVKTKPPLISWSGFLF